LKRDANANVVLNNLYKHSRADQLPGEHGGLVDGVAPDVNLAQCVAYYATHQIEVITRRSEFRLKKARERAHIVEGLLRAIDMLDAVIAAIRASEDRPAARTALMAEPFSFSEQQAEHILDMTLGRLTRLGRPTSKRRWRSSGAPSRSSSRSSVTRPACRAVITRSSARSGPSTPTTAVPRSPTTRASSGWRTHQRRGDRRHDDARRLHQGRAGGVVRPRAAAGAACRGPGSKKEDLVDDVVHTTTLAYLLLFSNGAVSTGCALMRCP